jgi:hypothetical protein
MFATLMSRVRRSGILNQVVDQLSRRAARLAFGCLLCLTAVGIATAAEPLVRTDDGIALHGYDAVSYQTPGGPLLGLEKLVVVHDGGTYRFATEQNRTSFVADPQRYVPAYGGWCAYAMADGEFVDVDPKTFKILDGRLLLFYNGWLGNTLKKWNQAEIDLHAKAEANWKRIVAERGGK